jgi:hypothetical protein
MQNTPCFAELLRKIFPVQIRAQTIGLFLLTLDTTAEHLIENST